MAESFFYRQGYFSFNLLPKRSKENVALIKDRDNTLLYGATLIFAAMIVFFVLTLLDTMLVQTRIESLEQTLDTRTAQTDTYIEVRRAHGEAFRKSILMQDPLEKDIQLAAFLDSAESLIGNLGTIIDYQRATSGRFAIRVRIDDRSVVPFLVDQASIRSDTQEVFIDTLVREGNSEQWIVTLSYVFSPDEEGTIGYAL